MQWSSDGQKEWHTWGTNLYKSIRLKPLDKQVLRVVNRSAHGKGSRTNFAFDPEEHIFELTSALKIRLCLLRELAHVRFRVPQYYVWSRSHGYPAHNTL